jgi:GT2 family glycosyltransferase
MSDIGIIIVTYNSAAEIGSCLDAAVASGADIVVVDNASHDGTIAEVARRGVRFIPNPDNRGFAGAVNQGFAELMNPYVLLLNPDAVIETSLEPLRQACDLSGSAGAGGQLVDARGMAQAGFMVRSQRGGLDFGGLIAEQILAGNPVNRHYRCLDWDNSSRSIVEQPAGRS